MFEISSKKVSFEKENVLIKRNINLDKDLDCFVIISTNNANLWDLLLNNILDFVVDKISKENTYNDFSIALESINSFLKTWEQDSEVIPELDMVISVLNENNYVFSNVWKSSCYLINKNSEVNELTNKDESKTEFDYVSSWELKNNEIVVACTKRLLDYLTKSDLLDWLVLSENIKIFNKNIKNILTSEILDQNILVSSLKYSNKVEEKELTKVDIIKDDFIKYFDNNLSKTVIGYFLILKDKVNASSKLIKNMLFLTWITISIFFLYSILSTVIWVTSQTEEKQLNENNILQAKNFIKVASENIANPEIFETNIKNAQVLLEQTKEKQIFLADVEDLNNGINALRKQFDKVEVFDQNTENMIYNIDFENPVKIVKRNLKPYIIADKTVVWPILPNTKAKKYSFNSLKSGESFVDATFIWDNMYLLTNKWSIVKFTKNWYFSYVDVIWQKTWEKSKEILSYSSNIYLIWEDNNQIYKHSAYWSNFKAGIPYLKKDDLTQIWDILSVSIDWWFYILKQDLSMVKFFSNPYRLEKLTINKLPRNYDIGEENSIIDIKARSDLNYVYMLLNNKIWVFAPNSKNYKNTKSLTYLWQVEWSKNKIKDFFVNHDWELLVLNKEWIYKVTFEISDDRLLVR